MHRFGGPDISGRFGMGEISARFGVATYLIGLVWGHL